VGGSEHLPWQQSGGGGSTMLRPTLHLTCMAIAEEIFDAILCGGCTEGGFLYSLD